MATSTINGVIINTASTGPAKIIISSINTVASLKIEPANGNCSSTQPGAWIDIQGSDGSIVIYTNIGNGYEYKRTLS